MSTSKDRMAHLPTELIVSYDVIAKQARLVTKVPVECYWFGAIKTLEFSTGKFLYLYDIAIPEQEVSSGSVDLEGTVATLMEELVAEGREEFIEHMKFFAHSHGNLDVFHSTTDWKQISSWASELDMDWFISHIQNRQGESTTRFDMYSPFRLHIDEIDLYKYLPQDSESAMWVDGQVAEKVKEKSYTQYHIGGSSYHSTGFHSTTTPEKRPLSVDDEEWKATTSFAWEHYIQTQNLPVVDNENNPLLDKNNVQVKEKFRERVIDGYIRERQNVKTGKREKLESPTFEDEKRAREEKKIVLGVHVTGRPARSTDTAGKIRFEGAGSGKAAARKWDNEHPSEGRASSHQIQTQSAHASDSKKGSKGSNSNGKNDSKQKEQLQLPKGVDADDILSDEEAAIALMVGDINSDDGLDPETARITELMQMDPSDLTDDQEAEIIAWQVERVGSGA